jgi:hypothetical protein
MRMAEPVLVRSGQAEFWVEVADTDQGPRPASPQDTDTALDLEAVRETVTEIGTKLTEAWQAAKPQEASVEFALKLVVKSGKLTGLLAEGSGEAGLKVTLTWRRPVDSAKP